MTKKLFFWGSFFLIQIFWVLPVFAKGETLPACQPEECMPAGLDFKTRQATRRLIEFEPFFGEYLGNVLNNSYVGGARLAFRFAEAMSVGVEFNYSNVQFDPNSNFGRSVRTRNEFITDAFFTYAFPILQRSGKTIEECDLFTTVGIGNIHINGKNRVAGLLGGGLKVYFKQKWLALRFDVNTYMYSLPRQTDSKFADDWSFTLGPSFLFLPRTPKTDGPK